MLQMWHFTSFCLEFKSNLLVKSLPLMNAAFVMTILDLTSRVHLAPFVITLPKQLEIFHILQLLLIYHDLSLEWFT